MCWGRVQQGEGRHLPESWRLVCPLPLPGCAGPFEGWAARCWEGKSWPERKQGTGGWSSLIENDQGCLSSHCPPCSQSPPPAAPCSPFLLVSTWNRIKPSPAFVRKQRNVSGWQIWVCVLCYDWRLSTELLPIIHVWFSLFTLNSDGGWVATLTA